MTLNKRSASTAGLTGGTSTHSHSVTIETGGPSSTSTAGGGGLSTATDTHTHSCSTTTGSASNLPPYVEVIYGQRKNPAPNVSLGDEESVSSGGGGGITYQYLYDGDGSMIAETIGLTTTVYIGGIYEKKDQGGTITEKKYYQAGSIRVAVSTKVRAGSWEVNFLLSDHLGSTSITTDGSGDTVSEMRYSPWGSVRFSDGLSPTDFTYTGQLSKVDHFGLMYYKARWYDRIIGFNKPDTLIPDTFNVLDFNRYSYSRFNPIRYKDPSGHCNVIALESGHCTISELFKTQSSDYRQKLLRNYALNIYNAPDLVKRMDNSHYPVAVETLAMASEFAARQVRNSVELFMEDMNAVFGHQGFGIESFIPIGISQVSDYSTVGEFDSSGLKEKYHDPDHTNDQIHHFWFYVQVAYYYGRDIADLGNLFHETLDAGGKSLEDYLLALLGAELGELLATGELEPCDVDDWIYENLANESFVDENWDYVPN